MRTIGVMFNESSRYCALRSFVRLSNTLPLLIVKLDVLFQASKSSAYSQIGAEAIALDGVAAIDQEQTSSTSESCWKSI